MYWIALAALAPVAAPPVTVTPFGSGYVARARIFTENKEEAVVMEMTRLAGEKCGAQNVRWGKFGSSARVSRKRSEPAMVSGFYKQFSCVEPYKRIYAAAPADWRPSVEDERAARATFDLYFAAKDRGDAKAASAMFDPATGISIDPADLWKWNRDMGIGRRQVSKVTWYVNPDSAAHPGIFVALDHVGIYKSVHFYCGYLMLYRSAPGAFEVTREEQNIFRRSKVAPDAAQLAAMRQSACRA